MRHPMPTNGDMQPPANYREWVYLSTGIDMSYSPNATQADHSMFDNVFVNPAAYRSFLATGTWPDKTVMVLEVRGAKKKGSINQRGQFQDTAVMGLEVHVKDEKRFPGKWAFFEFDSHAEERHADPGESAVLHLPRRAWRSGHHIRAVLPDAVAAGERKEDAECELFER